MKKRGGVPKWLRIAIPAVLITLWLGMSGLGGPYFGRIEEVSDNDLAAFLPSSAESTKVSQQLAKFQPDNTIPLIVAFKDTAGTLDVAERQKISDTLGKIEQVEHVTGKASAPIPSDDEKAAIAIVQLDTTAETSETLAEIRAVLDKSQLADDKIEYKFTGPAGFSADIQQAFTGIDGLLLAVALSVVFVILLIVYRSILLPVLVLSTSIAALSASIFAVWNFANWGWLQLNGQVQGILFILVIGAATDYSLLYVARYREALYKQASKWRAAQIALRSSVEPITASGGTVIAGLLCLLLSDLASNQALGPVGTIGIAMAILASLTFLPAMLYAVGRASFWPLVPRASKAAQKAHQAKLKRGVWQRVGNLVEKYPRPIWLTSIAVLVAMAIGVVGLRADGVSQGDFVMGKSEARDGQAIISEHFPDGSGTPAQIIVPAENYQQLAEKIETTEGVASVGVTDTDAAQLPLGKQAAQIQAAIRQGIEQSLAERDAKIRAESGPMTEMIIAGMPSVDTITAQANPFRSKQPKVVDDTVLLSATLADEPDSDAAKDTIVRLRERLAGADALVGGQTALQYDTNVTSIHDRNLIIPVVLVAITLILMVLLRSVLAPILLLATTVLSFGSSLGIAAWLFNDVWQFAGADPSVILYGFVFLVALGIDYNIFLMTRVREEALHHGTHKGVIRGLVVTGGVITSAGVVLASTFAALGVLPILFLFQLAFIVAFGVLLDTFLVRSLLVPALIRDIGSVVWWPSKLRYKK